MRILLSRLLPFLLLLTFAGCSAITAQHQDWDFIQSVGGLSVGGQDKNPQWLIIRGDVSGLQEFSVKPTQINSALAVKRVKSIVSDTSIQFYVVTTVISRKNCDTNIHGFDISGIKKGTYRLQYLNPDRTTIDLKEIEIY